MVDRISALASFYNRGKFGILGGSTEPGLNLQEIPGLVLHQIAAWPATLDDVGQFAASLSGAGQAPGPCQASIGDKGALLRIEPLTWWLLGTAAPVLDAARGATLDLSHSRTRLRISGPNAATFLNRHLSLDLREASFPVGRVGSTAIHHVGVTLWRTPQGYELFIPRGYALSLWKGFVESAMQFGVEIV